MLLFVFVLFPFTKTACFYLAVKIIVNGNWKTARYAKDAIYKFIYCYFYIINVA